VKAEKATIIFTPGGGEGLGRNLKPQGGELPTHDQQKKEFLMSTPVGERARRGGEKRGKKKKVCHRVKKRIPKASQVDRGCREEMLVKTPCCVLTAKSAGKENLAGEEG